jgi:hypothetical protein
VERRSWLLANRIDHVAWLAFIRTQHHKMVSGLPPTGLEMSSSSERANTHTATSSNV